MTFKQLLKRTGLTKAELARCFKMNPNTISAWGEHPPRYATVYLELLIEFNKVRP